MKITLQEALAVITGIFAKSVELKLKPLTVAVLDDGGHAVALHRQDGASFVPVSISLAKAYTAIGSGSSSGALGERLKDNPGWQASLAAITGGRLAPVAGGVVIRRKDGTIIGAVGVSGDKSELDEQCAIAGIEAAGFVAR